MKLRRMDTTVACGIATIVACFAVFSVTGCRKSKPPEDATAQPSATQTPPDTSGGPSVPQATPVATPSAVSTTSDPSSRGFVAPSAAPTTAAQIAAEYANRPAALAPMSLAEFQYGVSPTLNSDVTYQPDVVVMEHGAEAIHGYSSDGLTWLLDANAPHVADLQPGKIMFATGRAVGRILGVMPHGSDVAVTIGPASFTDVVSDLHMSFEQPVDLSSAIMYSAPDAPLTGDLAPLVKDTTKKTSDARTSYGDEVVVGPVTQTGWANPVRLVTLNSPSSPMVVPATWNTSRSRATVMSPVSQVFNLVGPLVGLPQPVNVSGFKVSPYQGGGLGISIARSTPELMMLASGGVKLDRPSLKFNLNITHGTVQTAEVELTGAAALLVQIQAGTEVGLPGNISKVYYVPTDFSIPIFGRPIPVAITFHQSFIVETAFTAKNSTLGTAGEEDFTGSVFMGLHNGSWAVGAPTSLTNKQDLLQSISGVSLGASSIIFGWGTKMIVGIGAFGFSTGPFLGYQTSVAVVHGSALTTGLVPVPPCKGAILKVSVNAGVGYSLPAPFVSAVNAVLNLLRINTQLPPSGGISHQEPVVSLEKSVPNKCASF